MLVRLPGHAPLPLYILEYYSILFFQESFYRIYCKERNFTGNHQHEHGTEEYQSHTCPHVSCGWATSLRV